MDDPVRQALARVFPDSAASVVRGDTPLRALGPIDEAWPLLAAALDELREPPLTSGSHRLDDAAAASIVTVGDLRAIAVPPGLSP